MISRAVVLIICFQSALLGESVQHLNLKWSELAKAAMGAHVTLRLENNQVARGRLTGVNADNLILDSGARARAFRRGTMSGLTIVRRRGPWRTVGLVLGVVVGSAAMARSQNAGSLAAVAGGGLVGYLAGRSADRREVQIIILPD
jgi:hypothetical protein